MLQPIHDKKLVLAVVFSFHRNIHFAAPRYIFCAECRRLFIYDVDGSNAKMVQRGDEIIIFEDNLMKLLFFTPPPPKKKDDIY